MSTKTIQPIDASTEAGFPPAPPEPHQQAGIALRAVQGEGEPQYIALGALRLDERNVRKDEPTEGEIEQLADLIDAQGLLQNLAVVAYAQPVRGKGKDKKRTFSHGVIAGGRRLRALLVLVKRGRITLDEEILCTVVSEDRALAVSTAENSGRAPMSQADTIIAFADMVKAGAGVESLAVCFGLSPLTVQRRLKLANVSPNLFGLFRREGMTLDQLMALALTDDHAAQETAWNTAPEYDRSPRKLRALIAGEGLSQAVIRFVTVEAYEAAGGAVLRDLFADSDEQPAYIQDPALMMRLASEKLEGIAQTVRDEGAAWVEVFDSWGYSEREQFTSSPNTKRAPTEEEAAALAELTAQADKLYEQLEAEYDSDDEDHDQERIDRLEGEAEEVAAKKEAIEAGMRVVLPEVAALTGAAVHIDHQGHPKIERNLLRKADAGTVKRAAAKAEAAAGGSAEGGKADEKGGVSDKLCHQLTAHRTRALQASLLGNQRAALAALVHPLLTRLLYDAGATWESPSAIKASAENCEGQLSTWAPDLAESRAEKAIQEAMQEARDMLPAEVAELLPWLLAQPLDTLVQLLTLCSALSLNAINGTGKHATTAALANVVNLNMADWWEATAASYLDAVTKSLIVEAVKEAGMADGAEALGKLKKGEAVTKAQELLAGKRWLPAVLRG
jgi:ParB family chromosome partitioning protein